MATAVRDGIGGEVGDARAARHDAGEGPTAAATAIADACLDGDERRIDAAVALSFTPARDVGALLVGPVTGAARRLGDYWVQDLVDFVAVTVAMGALRRAVERVIDANPAPVPWTGRRAVFAATPGDQHGFGSFVVNELFLRAGWLASPVDSGDLTALVADDWIDLVGLTASADCHCRGLAPAIAALRGASCNPRLAVIVGGRALIDDPALAEASGADGTAADARAALALADRLVAPVAAAC